MALVLGRIAANLFSQIPSVHQIQICPFELKARYQMARDSIQSRVRQTGSRQTSPLQLWTGSGCRYHRDSHA